MSADGSVVVGNSDSDTAEVHAFRWTGGPLVDLGSGFLAGAFDVSADGNVAVGVRALGSISAPDPEAVRWIGTSLSGLGDLPGGAFASVALAVSADGSIIVGSADDGSGAPVGFRWQSGTMTALNSIAPGFTTLLANGISADGAVIVGEDDDPVAGLQAFRLEGGSVTILPGMRRALDASGDGGIVVGTMGQPPSAQAALWTAAAGTRTVREVLIDDFNLGSLAGWTLEEAVAISADGLVIVGNGTDPMGFPQAWLADLSPGCSDSLDNDGDGLVDLADPGCDDASDLSEKSPALACDDFEDDDGDGLVDFPADPGCSSPTDPDEKTAALVCDDGLDNDMDGGVDVAGDPGCDDVSDPSEQSPSLPCDDGLDNDMDNAIDFPADPDCTSSVDPSEESIPGRVLGEVKISDTQGGFLGGLADGDGFGAALAGAGDLDANGVPDLVAGAPSVALSPSGTGRLFALQLDAAGAVIGETAIDGGPGGISGPLDAADRFGQALAALGDFDGNGVPDVAAGAPGDDDGGGERGAVWTLLLEPPGGVAADSKISSTAGSFAGPLDNLDNFGAALAPIGDFDGNGTDDLAVGAPGDGDGGFGNGAVWLLLRAASGDVVAAHKISETSGGFTGMLDLLDAFGSAVAPLGDLDGNGVVDLAVGAPRDDDGGADRGAVWILFLTSGGTVASHQKISATSGSFAGPLANGDAFGSALASLGDLDADGISELAVGAPGDDDGGPDRGALWILALQSDGSVKAATKISSLQGGLAGPLDDGDAFGSSVALLGDVGGDGGAEIAVGAARDDDGGLDRGAAYVLRVEQAICGDGQVEFAEICDDGNSKPADGCSAVCALQDGLPLRGTAQGGSVSLGIEGRTIFVATLPGQTASDVVAALAAEILADPVLAGLGVSAAADGELLIVDGAVIANVALNDPGLSFPAREVPPLSGASRLWLFAALLGAALAGVRGKSSRAGLP